MKLIIGTSCSSRPGLSEHAWVHRFNSRQKSGVTGGEPKNGVLILNRDWIEYRLPPRAPMALIICVSCSSQPGLSDHMWVHRSNFRQNPGVTGEEPKNGVLPMGGIQWNSEPTSPPAPFLKLIPIMQSFQDFPTHKKSDSSLSCSQKTR